jgi:hypothetical protein
MLGLLSGCATDRAGNTPLIRAAWKDDAEQVNALLGKGADVNARNRESATALMASTWGSTGRDQHERLNSPEIFYRNIFLDS